MSAWYGMAALTGALVAWRLREALRPAPRLVNEGDDLNDLTAHPIGRGVGGAGDG